jgi:kumamolisin
MSASPTSSTFPQTARYLGPHGADDTMEVTVVLRRRGTPPEPAHWPTRHAPSRTSFGERFGADPADVERLRGFARDHGLQETDCQMHRRSMRLRGSISALQKAFGVELGRYETADGRQFTGCRHAPQPSQTLGPHVIAVLGLDQRPVAKPHFRLAKQPASQSFTPLQVGQLYQYPDGTDGSGQTIALIELGGGYQSDDLSTYFSSLQLKTPTVVDVAVSGGSNQPGGDADAEVLLDIEVAGALANSAKIAVYFAPNTDQGFYEAISQAAHDSKRNPSVISISWGGPEDSWAATTLQAMESALQDATTLGVTVTAASGDSGSTDGETDGQQHVDYPSSSAYVLACGGTKLNGSASGTKISSETVWNELSHNEGATGGGVSASFALPTWQSSAKVPAGANGFSGRGVPDVAGNADPETGYQVLVDGQNQVIGGTSAVAPLWAALIARFNQQLGQSVGDVHEALYGIGKKAFHDITKGNNGAFKAASGWDACTGWGSPKGQTLLTALAALKGGGSAS